MLFCLSAPQLFGGGGAETPLRFDEQKVSADHKKVANTVRDRLRRMSPERKLLKATKTKDTKHLQKIISLITLAHVKCINPLCQV